MNKGKLKIDATVADQEIKYPTDLTLLNEGRENLERTIDLLYISGRDGVQPQTYRRKVRKEFYSQVNNHAKRTWLCDNPLKKAKIFLFGFVPFLIVPTI